jgi:carbamoyltransferase
MSTRILGISAFYHDSAACLLVDGEIAAAAQEERFTRRKHDAGFPRHAIAYCLREGGLSSADELDCAIFYDKPVVKFERLLETYFHFAPRGFPSFSKAMPLWLRKKLWMREEIRQAMDYHGRILFAEHHEAHAASAFFPSPFEKAAVLTADGVGEWATASVGIGEGNHVCILQEIRFPHSLGLLYSAFTYFTGFKVNSGEYKLMGLAPYGEPRFAETIRRELVRLYPDGSFRLNLRYFDYAAGLRMTNDRFARLFEGPARHPESELTQREMDLAASIQVVTEEVMHRQAVHAREATGCENLVLAGGVALNCVANGKLLREGVFRGIWIQPAAGDAGGALGAALFVHHEVMGNRRIADGRRDRQKASLLGPAFSEAEIARFVAEQGIVADRAANEEELVERAAEIIAQEKIVGWFQGRMEFGPRALGNRSILGDPRSRSTQTTMNLKIKFRESFRPFAPSVLLDECPQWFDLAVESPYMLLVADVHAGRRIEADTAGVRGLDLLKVPRSTIPAVTHVDGSARIQTVSREDNPLYYALIRRFFEKTGCPVVVNTSFNVRGEPIVCTPEDAWRCFARTNMDALVLGPFIIERARQNLPEPDVDWQRTFPLD